MESTPHPLEAELGHVKHLGQWDISRSDRYPRKEPGQPDREQEVTASNERPRREATLDYLERGEKS